MRRIIRGFVGLLLAALVALPAAAQENVRLAEQDIKAGLLYNFLRYTNWPPPARAGQNAVVCLYGRDPFGTRLTPMAGRTVNQRVIEVRRVSTFAEMNACSLLFFSAEERTRWPEARAYLATRDILTVSDYDGFARSGGMLEFTRANSRIGVRINVEAVTGARLSVEDRLMRLATPVNTERGR